MKTVNKMLGIAALVAVIAFSFAGCPNDPAPKKKPDGGNPVNAATPAISTQPQASTTVEQNETVTLSVTATKSDSGTLTYQWYSNTTNSATGGTAITTATSASYSPPTATVGATYYYVVVTNTNNSATGAKTATVTSSVATVTVTPEGAINAATPSISTQPASSTTVKQNETVTLSVTASASDSGTLSYLWYSNTANSATGGTAITTATNASYSPPTATVGTTYYYVVVTNTIEDNDDGGVKTALVTSNVATVIVEEASGQPDPVESVTINNTAITFSKNGTEAFDPASVQLDVSVLPATAIQTVTYSADPEGTVVTVSDTGLITPVATLTVGTHTADITVTSVGKNEDGESETDTITVTVTVTDHPRANITIKAEADFAISGDAYDPDSNEITLKKGEGEQTIEVTDADSDVIWYFNGTKVTDGLSGDGDSTLTLDPDDYAINEYDLAIYVTVGGLLYSKTIAVIVVED